MPSPTEIVTAALAVPLPCPVCERTETCRCVRPEGYSPTAVRADLIVAALTEYGHLEDDSYVSEIDVVQAAKDLGRLSRFIRYTGDGWKRVRESEADVNLAYNKASAEQPDSMQTELQRCRQILLDDLDKRAAEAATT